MNTQWYLLQMILVSAAVTAMIRFLPFLVLRGRETPPFIEYLGTVLPYAIMGMLVVYCLRETPLLVSPHGIPELCAVLVTAVLHIKKRSTLLSILGGTLCYMFLIQLIF